MNSETTVKRLVDDPMITPAELEYRRSQRLRKLERGWMPGKDSPPPPGKIHADVKLSSLIGGLSRIKDRTEAQMLAAARYRGLFDRSQVGGAKAVDYTAVRVDTSGGPVDLVFELGEDARREYRGAVRALGLMRSALVERVVCHDASMREVARWLDGGDGGAAQDRARSSVLECVEVLVDHFGYGVAHAKSRAPIRGDGETLPLVMNGRMVVPDRSRGR